MPLILYWSSDSNVGVTPSTESTWMLKLRVSVAVKTKKNKTNKSNKFANESVYILFYSSTHFNWNY